MVTANRVSILSSLSCHPVQTDLSKERHVMDCKVESNKEKCTCANVECERRGICCECLRAHLSSRSLPMCMRKLDWIKVTQ